VEILLTGATGFIGANVVRLLLAEGHRVRCVVRQPNRCTAGLDVALLPLPLRDRPAEIDALARAMEGCDGVMHLAGLFDPSPGGADRMREVHVDATRALLAAARAAGVPRFLTCSSSITVGFGPLSAPGDEDSPLDADLIYGTSGALRAYHDTKLEAEGLTAAWTGGVGVTVNPDFIIGPWDTKPTSGQLILSMGRGWVPVYPRGGKCFQGAEDCARGHLLALQRGVHGRRYLLGSHNLSYRAFMEMVAQVVGRRRPLLPLPRALSAAAGAAGALLQRADPHRFAGLDRRVLGAMQQARHRIDARARAELGLRPGPLEPAIEACWRWFVENGMAG
jgi:dihydroflavonol-4-reductase